MSSVVLVNWFGAVAMVLSPLGIVFEPWIILPVADGDGLLKWRYYGYLLAVLITGFIGQIFLNRYRDESE